MTIKRCSRRIAIAAAAVLLFESIGGEGGVPSDDAAADPPSSPCRDGSRLEAESWFEGSMLSPSNLTSSEFFGEYWTVKPVVLTPGTEVASGLFGLDDLDDLLDGTDDGNGDGSGRPTCDAPGGGRRRRRTLWREGDAVTPHPFTEVAKTIPGVGRIDPPPALTKGRDGRWKASVLRDAYDDGWSIVISKLYAFWEPVYRVIAMAERYFELATSGNLYITPPNAKGFALHFDNVDVFFLQISGRKRWRVYRPLVESPVSKNHPPIENEPRARGAGPLIDVVLEAGEVLYIPRGFLHEGEVPPDDDDGSIHLTFSPEAVTWYEFLHRTSLGRASGQPPPPGMAKDVPPASWVKPWATSATEGVPLPLRRTVPPTLSKACGTERIKKELLEVLLRLDPKTGGTVGRIEDLLQQRLRREGGIVGSCRSFLSELAGEFVSPRRDGEAGDGGASPEVGAAAIDGDGLMCAASAVGGRVARAGEGGAAVAHSTKNGPDVRLRDDGGGMPPGHKEPVPEWAVGPLSEALHPERNPSGEVRGLKSSLERAGATAGAKPGEAESLISRLLELGVVVAIPPSETTDATEEPSPDVDARSAQRIERRVEGVEIRTVRAVADASSTDDGGDARDPRRASTEAVTSILGRDASLFLEKLWGGHKWHHFHGGATRDFSRLWSLGLMEHLVSHNGLPPWKYEKDAKLVKDGQTHYTSRNPAAWSEFQAGLAEGASLVMNNIHHRHAPIYELASDLEHVLNSWVGINSYLTPANKVGFAPHYDPTDVLVLQLEGRKVWHLCEQRRVDQYRHKSVDRGAGIFKMGGNFGNCTEVPLEPGDSLYAPFGTIHYAKARGGDYSLHLTLSLDRQALSWGMFMTELADSGGVGPSHEASVSAATAASAALQRQVPRLHELRRSIDNEDLTESFLGEYRRTADELIRSEMPPGLRAHLKERLASRQAFLSTIDHMRQRLIMGCLKKIYGCPGVVGFDTNAEYRRVPDQGIYLFESPSGFMIALTGDREDSQHRFPRKWGAGLRFALSSFADGSSRNAYFSLGALAKHMGGQRTEAVQLVKELMKACLLEMRKEDDAYSDM